MKTTCLMSRYQFRQAQRRSLKPCADKTSLIFLWPPLQVSWQEELAGTVGEDDLFVSPCLENVCGCQDQCVFVTLELTLRH